MDVDLSESRGRVKSTKYRVKARYIVTLRRCSWYEMFKLGGSWKLNHRSWMSSIAEPNKKNGLGRDRSRATLLAVTPIGPCP